MKLTDIIRKKRDGAALTAEELTFVAQAAADKTTPDYQLSALLMAMYINGLNEQETTDLTLAMAHSGDMADLSGIDGVKADKHSTGGVGDKTTLIVAPLVAACGVKIAKMSGRGLGHTGGTVDKLESIPGLKTALPTADFIAAVNRCGVCVVGQSGNLCPADKRLYALRDVTETVSSIPLIASSVMSKKLAGGADVIVLDVKCGSGAFMKTPEDAKRLAQAMVTIGKNAGRKAAALITNMDCPLGNCIGNALEVQEAIAVLSGGGPEDLVELCLALAAEMLSLAGKGDFAACKGSAADALRSGAALKTLAQLVEQQGGDTTYIYAPEKFPAAQAQCTVLAAQDGYLAAMQTETIGEVCVTLGAGRRTKEDIIDPAAGIRLLKKTGDAVRAGEPVAVLYADDAALLAPAQDLFASALSYAAQPPARQPLVLDVVD